MDAERGQRSKPKHIKDTAARLGSRLDLLKFGRRTANPRHRTLRAAPDWSHDHLSEVEGLVLRRVAIFIGSFTLDTAVAIIEEGMSQNDVAEAIESLVDKSMVEAGVNTHETFYRPLDTTRTYALEKLLHRGEHDAIATRHANFLSKMSEENSVDLFEIQSRIIFCGARFRFRQGFRLTAPTRRCGRR